MRNLPLLEMTELETWLAPDLKVLKPKAADRYQRAHDALTAVLTGTPVTRAANDADLCPKRLTSMIERAMELGPEGRPLGYRVCVPWGAYCRDRTDEVPAEIPATARPHAIEHVLAALPSFKAKLDAYRAPLPPGRPPRSFDRLHASFVAELRKLGHDSLYPLNQMDLGRRALLRYLRKQRMATVVADLAVGEIEKPVTSLADILTLDVYDRFEFDAHKIDIEAKLGVCMANGGEVRRKITALWLLTIIECKSRAVIAWLLRVGPSYNNLDVALCFARALETWHPREFVIPGLVYADGAAMPSGLSPEYARRRGLLIAMDNAKQHHAKGLEQSFCSSHDGVLHTGYPHQPETRAFVEQLYSRLERGALRETPGGFEPATRLGEDKIRISNFSPDDYPIQLRLFEELLEVILTGYNATPHPGIGNLTPLQYLRNHGGNHRWFHEAADNLTCANELSAIVVPVTVTGSRRNREPPHVNYQYAKYRDARLDYAWEFIGQRMFAKVYRNDLRKIVLFRTATEPVGVLTACTPWNRTQHDETTRLLIERWRKTGKLKINGVDCAVQAYVAFLRTLASQSQQALDQLARMEQLYHPTALQSSHRPQRPHHDVVPRGGWVSMDNLRDIA